MIRLKDDDRIYPCRIYSCVGCPFDSEEVLDEGGCASCPFAGFEGNNAFENTEIIHLIRIEQPQIVDDYIRWYRKCIEGERRID